MEYTESEDGEGNTTITITISNLETVGHSINVDEKWVLEKYNKSKRVSDKIAALKIIAQKIENN